VPTDRPTTAPSLPPGQFETPTAALAYRRIVTLGLLLSMAVIAIETTVVTTALPTVIGELHGLELYPWVFSAYLLASTVTVPIFGKLADLYGRKPIILGGLAVFLLGTVLCGLASSMPLLVAMRALQGLGAGAVLPMTFTIVGDIYPLQERGKIQGISSTIWGVCSLAGPGLGAFLTLAFSWRWVFWINVPFALLAIWFLWRFLRERVSRSRVQVDLVGALTIASGLLGLMIGMLEGGRSLGWGSPAQLALLGASVLLLVVFVRVERRAAEPLLPLAIFQRPILAVASVANLLQGAQLFAISAYIPLFVQGVRGESAAGAGLALTPLLLGWSLTSTWGPRILLRFGFRAIGLLSTGLLLVGSLVLPFLDASTPMLWLIPSMALLGAGFGQGNTAFVVAVQSAVPWTMRGVATSTTQLFRNLGGTVGVALLGALLNGRLQATLPPGLSDSAALLNPAAREGLAASTVTALQATLAAAMQPVFGILLGLAVVCWLVVLRWATPDALRAALAEAQEAEASRGR
jgi:EmrB/QacA subfamily drug resistance transporter